MKNCMVIDDSAVVRTVARRILEDLHYTVEEAEDGQEGFNKCRAHMPDAIFVDWKMPIMDGIDFIKNLRGFRGGEAPKIIYCSTENDVGRIAMAIKSGADDYMLKPFDRDIMTAKFANLD